MMKNIQCPNSECWQRLSSGEECDEDICADHINSTLDNISSLQAENASLKKALESACKLVEDYTGDCPYSLYEEKIPWDAEECEKCRDQSIECWIRYFIEKE